jgi:6-phosphogluconate dehydrogenase
MGGNIARRLMRGAHACVVYDRDPVARADVVKDGASAAEDLADLVRQLSAPRVVWVMLPAGAITEASIMSLSDVLSPGDIVIHGGNTYYRDDVRRAQAPAGKGQLYIDVGASGGVWGLERGYCMMVGGDSAAVEHIRPVLETLAPGLGEVARTHRASDAD